jgi:hypothetical protein
LTDFGNHVRQHKVFRFAVGGLMRLLKYVFSGLLFLSPVESKSEQQEYDTVLRCQSLLHEVDYKWIGIYKVISEFADIVSYSNSGIFLPGSELAGVRRTTAEIIFNQDYYESMRLDRYSLLLTVKSKILDYVTITDYRCTISQDHEAFKKALKEYEEKRDEELNKRKL